MLQPMSNKTIYIASDHRGVQLKSMLFSWIKEHGFDAVDLGPSDTTSSNASDYAAKLAGQMREDLDARGILICGTGQAMTMTANRYAHLRAALCMNDFMARLARQHNDANVLTLGADLVGEGLALDITETFLKTTFLGQHYADRCKILSDLGEL